MGNPARHLCRLAGHRFNSTHSQTLVCPPARVKGPRTALVIGGGLSGCASANSLARRGWTVILLERHERLAKEASGNPQGVLYLKLSAHGTTLSQMIVSGFGYTRRLLEHLQRGRDWDDCGVLQLAFNAKEAARQAQLAAAFPRRWCICLTNPRHKPWPGSNWPTAACSTPKAAGFTLQRFATTRPCTPRFGC